MTELLVEIALVGCDPAPHIIYLAPPAESVEQYLQNPRMFLPTATEEVPRIVNKEQIAWVRTPPLRIDDGDTAVRLETIVELISGERMEGYTRLRTGVRLSDALNDGVPFLRIDEGSGTFFVNKKVIRFAIPR